MNYDLRTVDISALTNWDKNPRRNDEAAERVAASIARFGFAAPVIVQKSTNTLIAGHTRVKAAKKLGMTQVPAIFVDLDDASAAALAIADNKLNEFAEWDDTLLAEVLKDLVSPDDYAVTGFNDDEIDRLLREVDALPDEDPLEKEAAGEGSAEVPDREECTICIGNAEGHFDLQFREMGTGAGALEGGYCQLIVRRAPASVPEGLPVNSKVRLIAVYGNYVPPSALGDYIGTQTDFDAWSKVLPVAVEGEALLVSKMSNASEVARAARQLGYRVRCE